MNAKPLDLTSRLALRPKEAAEAIGVSERTLRKWMRDCGLPYARVDGVVLIPRAGLELWLDEQAEDERKTDRLADEILDGI
jgi:excisionase family DNA binding protein